jgi:F0F1-type ATP synthase membrane subunit b/b'
MENDKQMNNYNLEKVKQAFLYDDLLTKKSKPEVYSLADEFAKSKENRGFLVYGMILIYALIIGFGVYLLTSMEDQKSKRVEVNIAEFKQFNLDELLEKKKKDEEKLAQLQKELAKVKADSMAQIRKLTPEKQRKAMAELNEKLQKLEAEYATEVKQNKKTLKQLEKSVAKQKKSSEKKARKAEKLVEDYQKLSQKKSADIQKLTEAYERKIEQLREEHNGELERLIARYNPTFSEGIIAAVLGSDFQVSRRRSWSKNVKALIKDGILTEQQLSGLRQKINNQAVIIESLQEVGFINSVPMALEKLKQISSSIVADYEALSEKLLDLIDQKNKNKDRLEFALNHLARNDGADGFVIDIRQSTQLIIYLSADVSTAKGALAQVYKNDTDSILLAEIQLYPKADLITAKIKKRFGSAKIEPFDKVLLKTK